MIGAVIRRRLSASRVMVIGALGLGAALMMCSPSAWAALRDHSYFTIRELVISGHGPLLSEEAVRDWLGVSEGASLWQVSPARLRARLEEHPLIVGAAVRREFPRRIAIRLRERRPQAIVTLEELYYLDRNAQLFGPLPSDASRDYPVITGMSADTPPGYRTWALRRALRLLRRHGSEAGLAKMSEVHLDRLRGVVLYPTTPSVPIILGWRRWAEKLDCAGRVLDAWGGATHRLTSIDVRFRNQVVVTLRPLVSAGRRSSTGPGVRI